MSALERCVGDAQAFLTGAWARRSHLQQPSAGGATGFEDLLSLADVDRLVSSSALRVPLFRLVKDGGPLPVADYTRNSLIGGMRLDAVADPARVFAAFEDGATLVLQGLQRYWPPVAALCRDLERELGHPCQVNAYLTPPGARGLAVHSDPHDVFVLQAFGRKHWEVHPAPGEDPEAGVRDLVLEPGATLYLPTGTPHAARTQDVLSGHLTVGVLLTTWRRVVDEVVARLGEDGSLDERLPVGYPRDREGFAAAVAERLGELGRRMDKLDRGEVADAVVDAFLTTRPRPLLGGLVDRVVLRDLDDETPLRRRPGAECELRARPDGQLGVLLGDREVRVPAWLEPALGVVRGVAEGQELRARDLAGHLDEQSRLVLVRRLVREGLLEVALDR